MNKIICILTFFLTISICDGQNLVINPSFEDTVQCPNSPSQIQYAVGWFQPTLGTSDYYNACGTPQIMGVPENWAGYQYARSGNGYSGIYAYMPPDTTSPFPSFPPYREYIESRISTPLQQGQKYFVSFYVVLAECSMYSTDDIGVIFSVDSLLNDSACILLYSPIIENNSGQFLLDTISWTKISGSFIAQGGEQFITVGNFKDNANTDTIYLGVTPISQINAYYYIDDVCVSVDSLTCNVTTGFVDEIEVNKTTIFPNPFNDRINITLKGNQPLEVRFYDITSKEIFRESFTFSASINTEQLANGIYFYKILDRKGMYMTGKIMKQ